MHTFFKVISAIVVGSVLVGCGGEDFTGAYRLQESGLRGIMVLNIHNDEAEIFADLVADGIKPVGVLKVSQIDGKLFLDDKNSPMRLVMRRNIDGRSLDCLNCKVLGMRADQVVWSYDPKGPYDLVQLLREQGRKREAALNAELDKMQKEALEKGRRGIDALKLTPFEGDWVYQRATAYDPLTIMGIWRSKQIRVWSFKYQTMDRISYESPGFEVTDAGLKIGEGSTAKVYSLSSDKNMLTCNNCEKPLIWAKADPKKDLSDRDYARKMAGNP